MTQGSSNIAETIVHPCTHVSVTEHRKPAAENPQQETSRTLATISLVPNTKPIPFFLKMVRVVDKEEWSVQALRRIDLQPRLQRLVALGYIAAERETCRSGNLRGLSLPNLRSVSWPLSSPEQLPVL